MKRALALMLLLSGCELFFPRPADCADGRINGRETDLDCGGSCAGCAADLLCLSNTDCASSVCTLNRCAAPTCFDAIQNGDEREVDCGGGCPSCAPPLSCGPPLRACALSCVDPNVDRNHCGGCNQPCAPGDICAGGSCVTPCPPGLIACGGQCVSLERDPLHCGGCNMPCGPDAGCAGSQCMPVSTCPAPLAICPSPDAGPPACIDPRLDQENCGGCGNSCSVFPRASGSCVDAGCALGACQNGFENCNMSPVDGCEAEPSVDPLNCGLCGIVCGGAETCALGRCCGPIPSGTYQATCSGCEACSGNLTCMCNDAMQIPRPTSVPLGCVGAYTNCNGLLLCNGC